MKNTSNARRTYSMTEQYMQPQQVKMLLCLKSEKIETKIWITQAHLFLPTQELKSCVVWHLYWAHFRSQTTTTQEGEGNAEGARKRSDETVSTPMAIFKKCSTFRSKQKMYLVNSHRNVHDELNIGCSRNRLKCLIIDEDCDIQSIPKQLFPTVSNLCT